MKAEDIQHLVERQMWAAQWRVAIAMFCLFTVVLAAAFAVLKMELDAHLLEMRRTVDQQSVWMLATERRVSDAEHAVGDVLPRVEQSLERVVAVLGASEGARESGGAE